MDLIFKVKVLQRLAEIGGPSPKTKSGASLGCAPMGRTLVSAAHRLE
ncbi:hypothetical protein ACO2Q0_02275 [Phenylobacterium sp. VNQ135]